MAGPSVNLPVVTPADRTVAVLAVSPFAEDHARLGAIFERSNWHISAAYSYREAIRFLQANRMAVLICECRLPDGTWKDLLQALTLLPYPPLLVVTSKQADDALWAEVLNLGAYDVLSKPFDRAEVTRIISLAWLHWKHGMSVLRSKPVGRTIPTGRESRLSTTA